MAEREVFFALAGLFLCGFAASVFMRSLLNALMTQTAATLVLSVLTACFEQGRAAFALFALALICFAAFVLFGAATGRVGDDEKPLPRKIYALTAFFVLAAGVETAVLCRNTAFAVQIEALTRKAVFPAFFGGNAQILMLCGAFAAVCVVGVVVMCKRDAPDGADAAKKGN